MPDLDPTLADRLDAEEDHPDGGDITLGDLRAAAVRLREQDAEIARLKARIEHDRDVIYGYPVRVDKLDRIEAALAPTPYDKWDAGDIRAAASAVEDTGSGDGLKALLRRLADALEDPGTDG